MITRYVLATLAMLTPGFAQAQAYGSCGFTQECFEGEACADTAFAFDIRVSGPANDTGEALAIVTDAETIFVFRPITTDGHVMTGQAGEQSVFLSVAPDGTARYATHFNTQGFAITYVGRCEVP